MQSIKSFHVFEHLGRKCVINMDNMTAGFVGKETAIVLKDAEERLKTLSGLKNNEEIKSLGLFPDESTSKKEDENFPVSSIALFVTQTCNLRCIY